MMRRRPINRVAAALAIGVSMCVSGRISIADDTPVTLEKIIDTWKAREQKITSFDFHWWSKHFESEPDGVPPILLEENPVRRPDATFIAMYRFATDAQNGQLRTRLDERGREWCPSTADFVPSNTVEILDLGIEKRFHPQTLLGYPTLTTKGQVGLIDYHDIRSRPLRLAYRPLHSPIGVFPGQMTLRKQIDTAEAPALLILEHPDAKVWVDPAKEFLPVRYTKGGPNSLHSELQINYAHDEMFGWVPQSWTSTLMDTTGKTYSSDTAKVIEYSINKPLAECVFELELPEGTHVMDATSNEEFIIRSGGNRERIALKELDAANHPNPFIQFPAEN